KNLGSTSNTNLFGTTTRKAQMLYLPGDFSPAIQGGNITAIYFKYGSGTTNDNTLDDLIISLGQTTATAFNGGNQFFTGLTPVLERGTYTIPGGTTGDWFKIVFSTPFNYDSTQTLIVEVQYSANSVTTFGTQASSLAGRKIYATSTTAVTGTTTSISQDFGIELFPDTGNDAGVTFINIPDVVAPGLTDIEETVRNFSGSTLSSVTLTGDIDSAGITVATFGPIVYPGAVGPYSNSPLITIGSFDFKEAPYVITARTSQPNGGVDSDPSNDEKQKITLGCAPLTGTFTINQNAPPSIFNMVSFTDAVARMTQCGISGPVTFNVVPGSGPYVEQITITPISGASEINTITFNGNNDTIKFEPTSANRHIIKL